MKKTTLATSHALLKRVMPAAFALSLLLAFLSFGINAFAQQTQPTPAATPQGNVLAKVEFVGLKRITQDEALAATSLQAGQPIDTDAVDAAAARLLESGLFAKLSYNFRASKGQVTVTFKVEETTAERAPVVFDNFVWFTDKELDEFMRKNVTGYDGTATGASADQIVKILTQMLRLKGVEGKVEYMPSADPSGRNAEHLFTVRGAGLRVCELKFTGMAALKEETLVQNSAGIFANEYSRQYVRAFAKESLAPLYHARGHLRAAFRAPSARPTDASAPCSGVSVTIPVDEGIAYVWDAAEWSGNESLPSAALDAALGMTKKERADGQKIEKGVRAVQRAYARKGFLAARVGADPVFDDEARSVVYRFQITEGPQYRMGEVFITGLSEKDTNNLKTRWALPPREVFDADYPAEFVKKAVAEFMRDPSTDLRASGQKFKLETSLNYNREKLTVDVTINFVPQK